MNQRTNRTSRVLSSPFFWIGSITTAVAIAVGCSSSSTPTTESCSTGSTVACTCANGQSGTELCRSNACECASEDAGGTPVVDSGDHTGDGGHQDDGATPAALYSACALQGSFGWPCSPADAGGQVAVLDPTDCTNPNYPYCFLGGQGYWCTAACTSTTVASTCGVEDAGCAPRSDTSCNARGYCK